MYTLQNKKTFFKYEFSLFGQKRHEKLQIVTSRSLNGLREFSPEAPPPFFPQKIVTKKKQNKTTKTNLRSSTQGWPLLDTRLAHKDGKDPFIIGNILLGCWDSVQTDFPKLSNFSIFSPEVVHVLILFITESTCWNSCSGTVRVHCCPKYKVGQYYLSDLLDSDTY